ncbi:MAG: AtpZ/AtpI family protein [Armatimonadota bacterium]
MNKEKITPELLKEKIEEARGPEDKKYNKAFASSLNLGMSLGFTMVICIVFGILAGNYISDKTGNDLYFPLFVIMGILIGAYAAFKLIKPFLKS